MMSEEELQKIKQTAETFLSLMQAEEFGVEVVSLTPDAADINITLGEPQVFIGEDGKTLLDIQRLLRMIVNKALGKVIYVKTDINGYKAKKIEQLEKMADELADQVALTKISKALPPMTSYERRLVHAKLSGRDDVVTQSEGEGSERHLVITSK